MLLVKLTIVASTIHAYTTTTLSRNYFTVIKDTLYCDAQKSPRRRAAQFVLFQVLDSMFLTLTCVDFVELLEYDIPIDTTLRGRGMASYSPSFKTRRFHL